MSLRINVKLLNNKAKMPKKAYHRDAGFDMVAVSKKITEDYIEYGTGVSMNIPEGYVGLIFPRSSITKKDLILKNSVGVIDSGYLGEISFRFYKTNKSNTTNLGVHKLIKIDSDYEIGEKIGQIIFQNLPEVILLETEKLDDSERGEGGYGSTDTKLK